MCVFHFGLICHHGCCRVTACSSRYCPHESVTLSCYMSGWILHTDNQGSLSQQNLPDAHKHTLSSNYRKMAAVVESRNFSSAKVEKCPFASSCICDLLHRLALLNVQWVISGLNRDYYIGKSLMRFSLSTVKVTWFYFLSCIE